MTPHRLIGFVHPAADQLVGSKPFLLHAAFASLSSIAMVAEAESRLRVVKGPHVIVPYYMISPLDVWIGVCSSWVWVRVQGKDWKGEVKKLLLAQISPEPVATPGEPTQ